jgi:imidazolonepropionase-like amidohydrolase
MTSLLLLSLLACDQSPLLIRNVNVFTGERLEANRDVRFERGKVATIGKSGSVAHSGRSIDGSGNTLLPGLIDPHLHFSIPGLPAGEKAEDYSGRQLLRSGVTAGRLHLASIEKARELKRLGAEECAVIPALVAGGPGIAGGVPHLSGPQYGGVKNADDARAKVRRIAEAGLDWVALHDVEKFSPQEREALREEARKRRVKIFVAATSAEQVRLGLLMNAESLDYIDRSPAAGYPPELLAVWRKRKVMAVPTIGIFALYAACHNPGTCPANGTSDFIIGSAGAAVAAQFQRDLASNSYVLESAVFWPTLKQKLTELRATGAPVLVSTDVGSPAYLHEGAIWWEMETWKRMGVPTLDVLKAATSLSAKQMGFRDRGVIRKGAVADFVLFRGDPREGSFSLDRVLAVGRRGRLLFESGRWVGP